MIDVLMIVMGLVLLFFGGEVLIKGAVSLARIFGLSKLLVSAVIVGFGTSMPEMTVSVGAAIKGSSEIALGNVVGSNICNILLIIGLSAMISPITVSGTGVRRDAFMMIGASLILCACSFLGLLNAQAGVGLLAILLGYVLWSYKLDKRSQIERAEHLQEEVEGQKHLSSMRATFFSISGLILLVIGAYLMVEGSISIAKNLGISEAVIGLTIVAVGTSLPELATSLVAAMHKHSDVIIGNILGSNIFNILAILGVTAIVSPIPFIGQIASIDIWIMLAVAVLLSFYLLRNIVIGFYSGITMFIAYCFYTYWLYKG